MEMNDFEHAVQAAARQARLADALPDLLALVRELMHTTEHSLDDMEPETREALERAQNLLDWINGKITRRP